MKPIDQKEWNKWQKKYSWHLKVPGAYVQDPTPGVYGLEDNKVINSNDASALYPTVTVFSNISPETMYARLYDIGTIKNIIGLIEKAFTLKKTIGVGNVINQVLPNFKNALEVLLKNYFKRHSVDNKANALEFSLEYYPRLLKQILSYPGELKNIYHPKTDEEYMLLKSCFFPLIESIHHLSPQNRGYNQIIIDWIFDPDHFEKVKGPFYIFDNYNSTKFNFRIIDKETLINEYFKHYILNPYGSMFYKHDYHLAFEVQEIIKGLNDRRIVKNKMLVLNAINSNFNKAESFIKEIFLGKKVEYLSEDEVNTILDLIGDTENREKRIASLTDIQFGKIYQTIEELMYDWKIMEEQFDSYQKAIKVTLNSGYGILGLITFAYSDPICGASITTAGKIFGIKTFQAVSVWVMDQFEEQIKTLTREDDLSWFEEEFVDLYTAA